MNYCDDNGCIERKRYLTEPVDIEESSINIDVSNSDNPFTKGIKKISQKDFIKISREFFGGK